jgi:very-short-patch-repair endonuclease
MSRPLRGRTSGQTILTARQLRRRLTPTEHVLWLALRGNRFQGLKFRRQHPFGPYVLDFFCVQSQLAIELDGSVHDHPDQINYDYDRTAYLESNGLRVLRFKNRDITDKLEEVLTKIMEASSPTPQPPASPGYSPGEAGGAEGGGG